MLVLIRILNGVTLKTSNWLCRLVSMPLVILYHGDAPPYNLGNGICNQRTIVQKEKNRRE